VYVKEALNGPHQVLGYPDRYIHRVAISNNLLIDIADGHVTFRNPPSAVRLESPEFIQRFLLQVLLRRLRRIRHYGLRRHASNSPRITLGRGGCLLALRDARTVMLRV
jgi:hypothetical protein